MENKPMKTDKYLLKIALILLSTCIITASTARAMQQSEVSKIVKTYEDFKKKARSDRYWMRLGLLTALSSSFHQSYSFYTSQNTQDALQITIYAIYDRLVASWNSKLNLIAGLEAASWGTFIGSTVDYLDSNRIKNIALQELYSRIRQKPELIAALSPEQITPIIEKLNQKEIEIIFEQAIRDNKPLFVGLLIPSIKSPNIFLAMLPLARAHKHEAVIKLIVDEIRKHITPKIDSDMHAIGFSLPTGIPELITDYIAYAEPAAAQPEVNEEAEQD
jgi:hypothetical protein